MVFLRYRPKRAIAEKRDSNKLSSDMVIDSSYQFVVLLRTEKVRKT